MSAATYVIKQGDTLERISTVVYGIPDNGNLILSANPGLDSNNLQPGVIITVPLVQAGELMGVPLDTGQIVDQADNINEVAITVDGKRFRFWVGSSFRRAIGTIDTFAFSAPFEPDQQSFRDAFKPFSFKPVNFTIGGKRELTGTMVDIKPGIGQSRTIGVSGYSLPGVLNDCGMPATAYPIEYNSLNLRDIAKSVSRPFGISVDFAPDPGIVFERAALNPETKIFKFLADLAAQRTLVVGNDQRGALTFRQSVEPGLPVARLREGASPVLAVTPTFSPQQWFSDVTGINPSNMGDSGGTFTEKNPFLQGVIRPFAYSAKDTDDGSLKGAVQSKIARMVANAIVYRVQVNTWRDEKGNLWEPNTTLLLTSPGAMVYSETEFLIRAIDFARGSNGDTASIELVLPGAYSGKLPKRLPWE